MGRTSDARQRLMDAAFWLIRESSYGAVTIDGICERAHVKKGSFYYFFRSKSDLAVAAMQNWWESWSKVVDKVFVPGVAPMDRVLNYIDAATTVQLENYGRTGQVLGCALFTLGSEVCKEDEQLRQLISQIMGTLSTRFTDCVREAHANHGGFPNPELRGRLLWNLYEGTLTRARIENNPELLRGLRSDVMELMGGPALLAA